jgi:hypothetical protein
MEAGAIATESAPVHLSTAMNQIVSQLHAVPGYLPSKSQTMAKAFLPRKHPLFSSVITEGTASERISMDLVLGLPICRMLAQAHGGNVEFLDTTARGTVFRVTLQNPAE